MTHTLLLRLVGPCQAWDTQSRYPTRFTEAEPSKSGVVGLLCAAKGIDRDNDNDMLKIAALKMGARVDCEGRVERDYHTAGKDGYLTAEGNIKSENVILSERFYLADAAFLVGLESDDHALLEELYAALQAPRWPLFLGRKACVPGEPLFFKDPALALHKKPLFEALNEFPYRLRPQRQDDPDWMRGLIEDPQGEIVRQDQPLSFRKGARRFALRRMKFEKLGAGGPLPVLNEFAVNPKGFEDL